MIIGWSLPSASWKRHFMDSEYLVPSLKMWPTSMPRFSISRAVQLGQGSPAAARRMSATDVGSKSRPGTTPTRWASAALAPVAATSSSSTVGSASSVTPLRPTGPEKPCGPPVTSAITASEASWRWVQARAFLSLTSLTSRSPRIRTATRSASVSKISVLMRCAGATPRNCATCSTERISGVSTRCGSAAVASGQGGAGDTGPAAAFSTLAP